MIDGDYWLDTKWGCGWIRVITNTIVNSCPIFHRLRHRNTSVLYKQPKYKWKRLKSCKLPLNK